VELLTTGNTAKLYCLQWIEQRARAHEVRSILDLGCGTAGNFVRLLERYPEVRYVGVEPSRAACEAARSNLTGRRAEIVQAYAYDVPKLVAGPFDVVVSFSVFEHVHQRQRYLDGVCASLAPDGRCLINYDAGHFVQPAGLKERAKNVIGPLLARLGVEGYYQRFVPDQAFRRMVERAGLEILEAKSFNTRLKGVHKGIPPEHQAEHMRRWLDYELWLSSLDLPYDDGAARTWFTRNFILRRRSQATASPG